MAILGRSKEGGLERGGNDMVLITLFAHDEQHAGHMVWHVLASLGRREGSMEEMPMMLEV